MHDKEPDPVLPVIIEDEESHGDLRGSFTAVLLMAAFIAIIWFGVFAIAMVRR